MREELSTLSIGQQEQAEFRMKLDDFVKDTIVLSGNYFSHPASRKILDYDGIKAVPWLLEYLRGCRQNPNNQNTNPWVALEAIRHFVPEEYLPHIPETSRGKLNQVLDIVDHWGVYKGLLDPTV